MQWEFVPIEDTDLRGALLVVGVPSVGNVGPIAAGFVAEELGLRLIGGLHNEAMTPAAVVKDGVVSSPVQVTASELACGLDGRCDKLVVLKSDVALPTETLMPLASMVSRWAKERGVGLVIGLEGYVPEANDKDAGVLIAESITGSKVASTLQAAPVQGALLTGFNAALLVRANHDHLAAIGLFAPVETEEGDARAAARLLEVVDPLVPNIKLHPEELLRRAAEVEGQLQQVRAQQQRSEQRMQDQVQKGYV